MKQRFTLDRQSFEQFLAAISLFQPLQREAAKRGSSSLLLSLLETLHGAESGILSMQSAMERVTELALRVVGGDTAALWLFSRQCGKEEMICRTIAGKSLEEAGIVAALRARLQSGGAFEENSPTRLDLTRTLAEHPGASGSSLAVAILPGKQIAGGLAVFDGNLAAFRENNYSNLRLLAGLAQYILTTGAENDWQASPEQFPSAEIAPAAFREAYSPSMVGHGDQEPFGFDEPRYLTEPEQEIDPMATTNGVPLVWGNGVREALFSTETDDALSRYADFAKLRTRLQTYFGRVRAAVTDALPSSYMVRMNWHTFSQGMQALAVLAIMAFFTGLLTGGSRSFAVPSLNATAEAGTPQRVTRSATMAIPAPGSVLASSQTPITARASSHRQITDRDTEQRVAEMSRFEISTLRRAAEAGDDEAAFQLGMLYEMGREVPQSCTKAAQWVKRAAEAGNAAAEYNLGLRYRDGDGLAPDVNQAESWLRKAAAHKNRLAASMLTELSSSVAMHVVR